jgi:hypothetical protein
LAWALANAAIGRLDIGTSTGLRIQLERLYRA